MVRRQTSIKRTKPLNIELHKQIFDLANSVTKVKLNKAQEAQIEAGIDLIDSAINPPAPELEVEQLELFTHEQPNQD